jgi:hypothetical protein
MLWGGMRNRRLRRSHSYPKVEGFRGLLREEPGKGPGPCLVVGKSQPRNDVSFRTLRLHEPSR